MSPLARNKILINDSAAKSGDALIHGNAKGIRHATKATKRLGKELDGLGWLQEPEAIVFKERQEALCATFHPTQDAYQKAQREYRRGVLQLAEDIRQWIDKRLLRP